MDWLSLWFWRLWYVVKRRLCMALGRWGCVDQCNMELAYIDWYLEHGGGVGSRG